MNTPFLSNMFFIRIALPTLFVATTIFQPTQRMKRKLTKMQKIETYKIDIFPILRNIYEGRDEIVVTVHC